jgi:transposase-like protein
MKPELGLSDFSRMLKKVTVEAALGAELDDHLGSEAAPNQRWPKQSQRPFQ